MRMVYQNSQRQVKHQMYVRDIFNRFYLVKNFYSKVVKRYGIKKMKFVSDFQINKNKRVK